MRVLIACEESQAVCLAFRRLGHEAFSCDLKQCTGGHPEWHIIGDALEVARTQPWELMLAHPPCTFLAVSGARWMYHPDDAHKPVEVRRPHPKFPNRKRQQREAMEFVLALANMPIPRIAIENPLSVISSHWRPPDQIIQPYWFGHKATKATCLWLKNLPKLKPTEMVDPGEYVTWICTKTGRTKRQSKWYFDALKLSPEERSTVRSKTFPGIAAAMAEQWTRPDAQLRLWPI